MINLNHICEIIFPLDYSVKTLREYFSIEEIQAFLRRESKAKYKNKETKNKEKKNNNTMKFDENEAAPHNHSSEKFRDQKLSNVLGNHSMPWPSGDHTLSCCSVVLP